MSLSEEQRVPLQVDLAAHRAAVQYAFVNKNEKTSISIAGRVLVEVVGRSEFGDLLVESSQLVQVLRNDS